MHREFLYEASLPLDLTLACLPHWALASDHAPSRSIIRNMLTLRSVEASRNDVVCIAAFLLCCRYAPVGRAMGTDGSLSLNYALSTHASARMDHAQGTLGNGGLEVDADIGNLYALRSLLAANEV